MSDFQFIAELERLIGERIAAADTDGSYTARLAGAGINRVAQKVGEEGVEVAVAAASGAADDELIGEAADLLYHLAVLLALRGRSLADVADELARRHTG